MAGMEADPEFLQGILTKLVISLSLVYLKQVVQVATSNDGRGWVEVYTVSDL
jgi:hypothetical protein